VIATGWADFPNRPDWPGCEDFEGALLHSSEYRNSSAFVGKRVLVVGFGNSGGEIALDVADANIDTTLAVRGPAHILPRDLLGFPILAWAIAQQRLPTAIVDFIDIGTLAKIRDGAIKVRGGIERFTPDGVIFFGSPTRAVRRGHSGDRLSPRLAYVAAGHSRRVKRSGKAPGYGQGDKPTGIVFLWPRCLADRTIARDRARGQANCRACKGSIWDSQSQSTRSDRYSRSARRVDASGWGGKAATPLTGHAALWITGRKIPTNGCSYHENPDRYAAAICIRARFDCLLSGYSVGETCRLSVFAKA
jgi:hypothetical protein